MCVEQLEAGRADVEDQYVRAVRPEGNRRVRELLAEVFCVTPRHWRGIGEIPNSGLSLCPEYADFDADAAFPWRTTPIMRSLPTASASAARSCRGSRSRANVRRLDASAPPSPRLGRPWFPPKAPAPRTTVIEAPLR
jgi:hydrogenase expression/formation protein HypD